MLDGSVQLKLYTSVHELKHLIKGVLVMLSLAVKFQYKSKGRLISDMWVQLERKLGLDVRVSVGGGWCMRVSVCGGQCWQWAVLAVGGVGGGC